MTREGNGEQENGDDKQGWVFDEEKACTKIVRERRRLAEARNERTTAKERLERAHRDNQLAMSAPLAVKRRRLAKMREYAIEVKIGNQASLSLTPAPGLCCPDADCRYERWDRRRCSECGRACTESCAALSGKTDGIAGPAAQPPSAPMAREPGPEEHSAEYADEDGQEEP